jgi:hypothetical protein
MSHAEAQEIVHRNWLVASSNYRSTFPGLDLYPFVEKIDIDEGVWEYQASRVGLFSIETVRKLWSQTDIASARAAYDRWLRSSDASLENPVNRECVMLRRCVEDSAFFAQHSNGVTGTPVNPSSTKPKRTRDHLKKKEAERLIVLESVAQKIIDATLANEKIPFFENICEQLVQEGILKENPKTFRNFLSTNEPIQKLMHWAKKRPDNPESIEYQKWRKCFMEVVAFFDKSLIQRDDAGLTDEERKTSVMIPLEKTASKQSKKKEQA